MRKLTIISLVLALTLLLTLPSFSVVADEGVPWFGLIPYLLTGGPPSGEPKVFFSANPTSGQVPLTVDFDASGSTDPDATIESYEWNFGDGFSGFGETISHTFISAGDYTVKLTVTNNDEVSASTTTTITVYSTITREFTWQYDDANWYWELSVPESEYLYWDGKETIRDEIEIMEQDIEYIYSEFVENERDDKFFSELIDLLGESMGENYYKTVEDALYFTRKGIEYTAGDNYVKYPIETLVEGGDCEDQAILYTSLVRELGYGALLVGLYSENFTGHMIAGVPVSMGFIEDRSENYQFSYVRFEGKYYALADPGPGKFVDHDYDRLGEGDFGQYDTIKVWDVSKSSAVKAQLVVKK